MKIILDEKEKGVGPGHVTDIHRNELEIWANNGPEKMGSSLRLTVLFY